MVFYIPLYFRSNQEFPNHVGVKKWGDLGELKELAIDLIW
jgi:hypothetical protein